MLCCICKEREATVHVTQIDGDKMDRVDICEDCAMAKGLAGAPDTGFSLADLMLSMKEPGRPRISE